MLYIKHKEFSCLVFAMATQISPTEILILGGRGESWYLKKAYMFNIEESQLRPCKGEFVEHNSFIC